jgi:hypothetical protein
MPLGPPDALGNVERATVLFERSPLAAVAAFFTIAFFVSTAYLVRRLLAEKDRRAEELLELTVDTRAVLVRFVALAEEAKAKKRWRRLSDTDPCCAAAAAQREDGDASD